MASEMGSLEEKEGQHVWEFRHIAAAWRDGPDNFGLEVALLSEKFSMSSEGYIF